MGIHKSFQFLTSGKAFVIPHALDLDRANGVGSLNGFPQGETLIESAEDAGGKAISSSDGIHKGIFLIRGALEIFFPGGSIGAAFSRFYDYSFCTLFQVMSPYPFGIAGSQDVYKRQVCGIRVRPQKPAVYPAGGSGAAAEKTPSGYMRRGRVRKRDS